MMFYILMGSIALIGLLLVFKDDEGKRKVDIDISKGKFEFSIDKPIVEQVNQSTQSTTMRGEQIDFTTGSISPEVIEKLQKEDIQISPDQFTGKNLINKTAGYILTVNNPQKWNVQYNPIGLSNSYVPINIISGNGGDLRTTRSIMLPGADFQSQVEMTLQMFLNMGIITQMPDIKYDDERTTAFLTFTNQQTGGISYMKLMQKDGMVYGATANYNSMLTSQEDVNELINMVASFTVIGPETSGG